MSKARLVITAVTVEKRPVSEVARSYGVARSWIYTLLDRYQAEGEAAFEPRSRRPKTSPTAIGDDAAGLIVRLRKELAGQGLDAGPQIIAWHLERHHQLKVSPATVSRYLARAGLVTPDPMIFSGVWKRITLASEPLALAASAAFRLDLFKLATVVHPGSPSDQARNGHAVGRDSYLGSSSRLTLA
ncbi:MAG: helix-turn-helix domain-containing protein [Trebonia sp.]